MGRPDYGQSEASDMLSACTDQRFAVEQGGAKAAMEKGGRARPPSADIMGHVGF